MGNERLGVDMTINPSALMFDRYGDSIYKAMHIIARLGVCVRCVQHVPDTLSTVLL